MRCLRFPLARYKKSYFQRKSNFNPCGNGLIVIYPVKNGCSQTLSNRCFYKVLSDHFQRQRSHDQWLDPEKSVYFCALFLLCFFFSEMYLVSKSHFYSDCKRGLQTALNYDTVYRLIMIIRNNL